MRKTFFLLILLSILRLTVAACDACTAKQTRLLRGISHGAGPETKWDYWIVALVVVLVILTLFYSVKWLVKPGEKSPAHIKNLVLITT
jgi:H+/Cl- antiporter ClcA